MDCIDEGLIQMYIDGETSLEDQREIEDHIASCPSCKHKLVAQKELADEIKKAINLLGNSENPIPIIEFHHNKKKRRISLKQIVYMVSAASVLLIGIRFFKGKEHSTNQSPLIFYEIDGEIDANKPITEQDFTIRIIEPNSNTTELLMN